MFFLLLTKICQFGGKPFSLPRYSFLAAMGFDNVTNFLAEFDNYDKNSTGPLKESTTEAEKTTFSISNLIF